MPAQHVFATNVPKRRALREFSSVGNSLTPVVPRAGPLTTHRERIDLRLTGLFGKPLDRSLGQSPLSKISHQTTQFQSVTNQSLASSLGEPRRLDSQGNLDGEILGRVRQNGRSGTAVLFVGEPASDLIRQRNIQMNREIVQWLESWHRAGVSSVRHLDPPPPVAKGEQPRSVSAAGGAASPRESLSPAPVKPSVAAETPMPRKSAAGSLSEFAGRCQTFQPLDLSPGDRVSRLAALKSQVAACRKCQELASTRTQTVFGVGDPQAKIVFVGEAPGADEDRVGEPFVGRAGQLLNDIIRACRLKREEIYICNVLRCRPPGNRLPSFEEAQNCREFLDGQLAVVNPDYIVCWGSCAAKNLLGSDETIGKLRGRFYTYGRAKVLCTYHPSYLLRNPAAKKDVWEDMKFLFRDQGIELSAK